MQPYEILQLSDGPIDYSRFRAWPIKLLSPTVHAFWAKVGVSAMPGFIILAAVMGAAAATG